MVVYNFYVRPKNQKTGVGAEGETIPYINNLEEFYLLTNN